MSEALVHAPDRLETSHLDLCDNMDITSVPPSVCGSPPQTSPPKVEEKPKRSRGKNVSWPAEDKLCQVRLFAAEDAPSTSGTVLQDLLQAKLTKFMHAATPVPTDDLPPGFEGVAAKRAKLDVTSIDAIAPQIPWRCPDKLHLDPSWQVVSGEESKEATAQCQREVRVLEAVYPRPSAIPHSPADLQETPQDVDDTFIPQIPLVPLEDDVEIEDESVQAVGTPGSGTSFFHPIATGSGQIDCLSPTRSLDASGKIAGVFGRLGIMSGVFPAVAKGDQSKCGLKVPDLRDADPNVAAAAAAAYAAVKSKEAGRMIDHDLLIKILTNPILVETLTALNQKPRNLALESLTSFSNIAIVNGNHCNIHNEQVGGGTVSAPSLLVSQTSSSTPLPEMRGGQKCDVSVEGRYLQGVQGPQKSMAWSAGELDRSFSGPGAHEQSNGVKGAHGSVTRVFGMNSQGIPLQSQMLPQVVSPFPKQLVPPHPDYLKELIQQHGVVRSTSETQSKHGHPTSLPLDEHYIERQRAMSLRLKAQPSGRRVGTDQSLSTSLATRLDRDDTNAHDRPGGSSTEVGRMKSRKPCLYFNTPRGCRNGVNCTFLHEVGPDKVKPERTRIDSSQLQQVKRPKVETEALD